MSAVRIDIGRRIVKRTRVLLMVAVLFLAVCGQVASAEGVYIRNPKPPTDGRIGSNYTSLYAVNQVQFWHDFRPEIVESDPQRGLRIDYTDKDDPILSGAIGVRTHALPQSCSTKEGEQ
jgi:hypothetical protein